MVEIAQTEHRHVADREALRNAAVDLVTGARREVLICSPMLEASLYNRADLSHALGQLIARRAGNRIRILVEDAEHMLLTDVRLVDLARRFSDLILIRRLGELHLGMTEMFIVADGKSCLHQRDLTTVDATCDFHSTQRAEPLARRFDTLWAASEPLPGLHPFRL